jgi:hypothetical protein
MTTTFYFTIASEGFFPNFKVDIDRFTKEIRESSIVTTLDTVSVSGGNCVVVFKDNLSQEDSDTLLALVQSHSGLPLPAPSDSNGIPIVSLGNKSSYGINIVESAIRSGTKTQQISQNFCDKHTWYSTSQRHTGIVMQNSGDGYSWDIPDGYIGQYGIVDVTHGRILHERRIRDKYRVKVYVNGVEKLEKDPHNNNGDFVIDVDTGRVTFDTNQAGNLITIDFSEVKNSRWYLKPTVGKKLRLVSAELQFSTDAQMKDTFVFQMYATVDKFPPLFFLWNQNPYGPPGPYPAETKIPIGDAVYYQNVFDLICEANLAYPVIPKWQGQGSTWRDLKSDVMIFSWEYGEQASIDIDSKYGMEIEIRLEHDQQCDGSYAVVTFYCVSEDT